MYIQLESWLEAGRVQKKERYSFMEWLSQRKVTAAIKLSLPIMLIALN